MKKAAIYIRVSTEAQREEGYSIDAQKEMLQSFCKSKGIKDYELFIDGGFSGSNIERPEMARLISEVKAGKISHVIVYKLDRLSRSQKDTLYLIEDVFNPYSVSFISLNENMDTSTPIGRAMLGIMSAFAQLERETIRERTRMGMKERIKSGLWMGGGRIPFGYDYDKGKGILVPNKDADIVRKIYDLYLKGYSTAKISEMLGLKYEKLAQQILNRKTNAGFICYNGEEYLGKHEPIISLETYEKAMEYMQERSQNKLTSPCYLLTGLIYCGKCGAKMRYQKWGKNDCKIVCYSQDKSKKHLIKDQNCDNQRIWASDLEDIVIKDIFSLSFKSKNLEELSESTQSVMDILRLQYESIANKIKRLYTLYSENEDKILLQTIEDLKKELSKINEKIKLENEKSVLEKRAIKVKKKLETIKDTWEYMTKQEQKNIVRSCIEKIVLTDDNINIYYNMGINL